MDWWRKRQAKKKMMNLGYSKEYVDNFAAELEKGHRQIKDTAKRIQTGSLNDHERLMQTISQVKDGNASKDQKLKISMKLIENANVTPKDKAELVEWVEHVYGS